MHLYNFNQPIDRHNTACTQWDFIADRFGRSDLLPFTISDMDIATPPFIISALKTRLGHPIFGYTRWQTLEYKNAIVNWWQQRFDFSLDCDWLVYTPGVINGILRLINLWSQPENSIIIQPPVYDAFSRTIAANHRNVLTNPLLIDNKYEIDWYNLESQLKTSTAKILLLCNPHNPVGKVWSYEELLKIANLCNNYGVSLISDEIHMDFIAPNHQFVSLASVTCNTQLNINWAVFSSCSKTFNTPGLGGAYGIIADTSSQQQFLSQQKNEALSSANIMSIVASIAAYSKDGIDWVNQLNIHIQNNKKLLQKLLQKAYPYIKLVDSSGTYLPWLDCRILCQELAESNSIHSGEEQLQIALISTGQVAIMRGSTYGEPGTGFLRFNIGCSESKMLDGINRLIKTFDFLMHGRQI